MSPHAPAINQVNKHHQKLTKATKLAKQHRSRDNSTIVKHVIGSKSQLTGTEAAVEPSQVQTLSEDQANDASEDENDAGLKYMEKYPKISNNQQKLNF